MHQFFTAEVKYSKESIINEGIEMEFRDVNKI